MFIRNPSRRISRPHKEQWWPVLSRGEKVWVCEGVSFVWKHSSNIVKRECRLVCVWREEKIYNFSAYYTLSYSDSLKSYKQIILNIYIQM